MDARLKAVKDAVLERHKGDPNVIGASVGYKRTLGKTTDEISVVVYVKRKIPEHVLPSALKIAKQVDGVSTDVQQVGEMFKPLVAKKFDLDATARSLTQRLRPLPAGYSIGHFGVTAGTAGVRVLKNGEHHILSNNHVLANENDAVPGDLIYQPGPLDGGGTPAVNRFATLTDFVRIRYDGEDPGEPTPPDGGFLGWLVAFLRWLLGWLFGQGTQVQAIDQPFPNLVDAALARVSVVDDMLGTIGPNRWPVTGMRDPQLGEIVRKAGRTTEMTEGRVEAVDGTVQVQYDQGIATFEDQVFIRSTTSQTFSGPGDSGSAILTANGELGALLFAGGGAITIASPISEVQRLLGFTL